MYTIWCYTLIFIILQFRCSYYEIVSFSSAGNTLFKRNEYNWLKVRKVTYLCITKLTENCNWSSLHRRIWYQIVLDSRSRQVLVDNPLLQLNSRRGRHLIWNIFGRCTLYACRGCFGFIYLLQVINIWLFYYFTGNWMCCEAGYGATLILKKKKITI